MKFIKEFVLQQFSRNIPARLACIVGGAETTPKPGPGGNAFGQAGDVEGDVRVRRRDCGGRSLEQRATDVVLDHVDAVLARDVGQGLAAARAEHDRGRVVVVRHQEDRLGAMLDAGIAKRLGHHAGLVGLDGF